MVGDGRVGQCEGLSDNRGDRRLTNFVDSRPYEPGSVLPPVLQVEDRGDSHPTASRLVSVDRCEGSAGSTVSGEPASVG